VLDRPRIGAVIIGARNRKHVADNADVPALPLSERDIAEIAAVTARAKGPLGDCYALERDLTGRHGSIMHYDNNAKAS
jgi:diketogulonate reductase-like aldo/keto reductase